MVEPLRKHPSIGTGLAGHSRTAGYFRREKATSLMLRKLYRAWCFYRGLNYPWDLAWHKALREKAPEKALNDAMLASAKRFR